MVFSNAFVLLSALCCLSAAIASEPIFYESFDEPRLNRWSPSMNEDYQGVWKYGKSEGHEDFGLLVSQKARKYGIATPLSKHVEFGAQEPVVLQYDLRLQNGIECGGAYLKFLQPQAEGWIPSQLHNEAPYSIMFGPDKCGSINKVHFIFRHKSPKTGKYVEHHLKNPPAPMTDKLTHVYTVIIYPNNTLSILIDGEVKKTTNLLSADFDPSVLPPEMIPDIDDKKPEDWDERPKIPDAKATKPDDWDEDAPYEIEDMEATKPEGWLDDEPEEIDDEEATKPEDWDDDEDGEWEVPKVPNPKCEDAPGCGEWVRPMKKNPAYKGKWHAPMIDNPDYRGIWKAREIPNPDYFHLDRPNLEPITAIAIEIWTMQDGILFDNVLVTSDVELAKKYRDRTWKVKFDGEKMEQKKVEAEEAVQAGGIVAKLEGAIIKLFYLIAELPLLASHKGRLMDLIEDAEEHRILTMGVVGGIFLVLLFLLYKVLFGRNKGSKQTVEVTVEKAKKEDITPADDVSTEEKKDVTPADDSKETMIEETPGDGESEIAAGDGGARSRRSHRET